MSSGWKGVLESFHPFLVDAMGRSQQGSDHHAPVAAVTPDHDIGDDPPGEIIVILEGKVESSGKGLVNVAGRAENLTDDVLVRPGGPAGGLATGKPVPGFPGNGLREGSPVFNPEEQADEAVGRPQDVGVTVRKCDVGLDDCPFAAAGGEGGEQGRDRVCVANCLTAATDPARRLSTATARRVGRSASKCKDPGDVEFDTIFAHKGGLSWENTPSAKDGPPAAAVV